MTATERLRELLDERGVEYLLDEEYGKKYPPENRVTWSCDLAGEDMTVTARDYFIGDDEYCLDLEFHEVFTPEQAIAATLGSCNCSNNCTNSERTRTCLPHFWTHDGTLHIELPKLPDSISVLLPDERDREVHSARVWLYTRDSWTCHDEGDPGDFCCSERGVRMFTDTSDTYTMIASDGRTIINVLHTRTQNGYESWQWLPVRERIVRCRDCKHAQVRHLPNPITGMPAGIEDWLCDYFWNADELPEVEPDGFCAWGERKEEDE